MNKKNGGPASGHNKFWNDAFRPSPAGPFKPTVFLASPFDVRGIVETAGRIRTAITSTIIEFCSTISIRISA